MRVKFKLVGLEFEADVNITPFKPAKNYGNPEFRREAECGEIEFLSLKCDGKNADFLHDSEFSEKLAEAAYKEAVRGRQ